MCDKLPYILVHSFLKSDNFWLNPSNLIFGYAKDKAGIEMQFTQAERGPSPIIAACKLSLMKIHNFFFLWANNPEWARKKNMRRDGLLSLKWPLFKNHKFVSSKKYRPNSQFLFTFPVVLSHKE